MNTSCSIPLPAQEINPHRATVADIALAYPHAISVLNRNRLDYCCQGKTSFSEACKKAQVDETKVWNEIISTKRVGSAAHLENWDTALLVEFILKEHHAYVRQAIPQLFELLDKVCDVHGKDAPQLLQIRTDFHALAEELMEHMPKEEEVLFPAIKQLSTLSKEEIAHNGFLDNFDAPINVMEHEHEAAGRLLKSIRSLANNFIPPAYACPTFQLTYKILEEFERDLMQHVHIENNILFPKVKEATC